MICEWARGENVNRRQSDATWRRVQVVNPPSANGSFTDYTWVLVWSTLPQWPQGHTQVNTHWALIISHVSHYTFLDRAITVGAIITVDCNPDWFLLNGFAHVFYLHFSWTHCLNWWSCQLYCTVLLYNTILYQLTRMGSWTLLLRLKNTTVCQTGETVRKEMGFSLNTPWLSIGYRPGHHKKSIKDK